MLTYCLQCKRNTENVNSRILEKKNGRTMLSSKLALCGSQNSGFIKEQAVND